MALNDNVDKQLLIYLCSPESLCSCSFNSKNMKGKTPIILAIENRNMGFLEVVLTKNKEIYLEETYDLMEAYMKFFSSSTTIQD